MTGIGIITNPHSKLNKRNPKRQELLTYVAGEQGQVRITHSLEELAEVAHEYSNKSLDILAINGGDGTISRTLTTFIHAYGDKPLPPIVILRGGTINMLAKNLGITGSPEQVLFRLMEAYSTNEFKRKVKLPTLKVGNEYGFLFGNGSCHAFLQEFYKNKTGAVGSLLLLLKIIFSRFFAKTFYDRIIFDQKMSYLVDRKIDKAHRSCSLFCSVVEKMPLGKKLFYELNSYSEPCFQAISAILPASKAWYQLPLSVILKPKSDPKSRDSFIAKKVELTCETYGGYTLDGELFEPKDKKVTIEMGPTLDFYIV